MNAPISLPGPLRQVGYVVADVDAQIWSWVGLGVGPWFVLRGLRQRALDRGTPCEVGLTIAFSHSGGVQLELIQQEDDTSSIFTEFLADGPGGFHQLAWWPTDFDAALTAVQNAGYPVVWSSDEGAGARFAYFEPQDGPATVIELSEYTPATAHLDPMVRDAADNWDGSDRVRPLGPSA